ncbi:MAG: hypothetical protein ACE5PM_02665 [Candidatus Hydrothermarchaeales archaeon]
MTKNEVYLVENISIECNDKCPFYHCGSSTCKIKEHVMKYSKLIREGHTVSML